MYPLFPANHMAKSIKCMPMYFIDQNPSKYQLYTSEKNRRYDKKYGKPLKSDVYEFALHHNNEDLTLFTGNRFDSCLLPNQSRNSTRWIQLQFYQIGRAHV